MVVFVFVVVVVVAGVVSVAFRVISNCTWTNVLILLVCLQFLPFLIRLYFLRRGAL